MKHPTQPFARRLGAGLLFAFMLALGAQAQTQAPAEPAAGGGDGAATLKAKYQSLQPQLANNPFKRRISLESTESSSRLAGDIYAVVDHPFERVRDGLKSGANWCEVLMLHLNTKQCLVKNEGGNAVLSVALGRKFDQPLSDAQVVKFNYRLAAATSDYLDARLSADEGPLSTRNYRIELTATPIDAGKSFIHLSYSYAYGTAARLAMQAYLATLGSDKVGFTATGKEGDGSAQYIGGVRGVVERNTMRYYLAIDSFLDFPTAPEQDKRFASWFDATEQYAKQLHEVERNDYITMKRNEYRRMKEGGN
ncbi:hypothetical protein [Variovorax sp. OV329]|uniref:hypothetical protein n=1 Tax=Variovorax sp. OV329 TaxID=1882825 RepID=UPI0008E8F8CA|nr:hypothetical protein [Variovorax sp. OV329]SFN24373.1 hypothetical protein SAMN05444747_11934 [Variovorax sp. OV329]